MCYLWDIMPVVYVLRDWGQNYLFLREVGGKRIKQKREPVHWAYFFEEICKVKLILQF